jgi:hypothetical protein
MPKWFHITISVLLALLAIGFSILICGKHHWGYIPCAAIAIVLFACFYGFLRLCFWAGAKITFAYADAFQKFVRPRIEVEAIQKYIAEHPEMTPRSLRERFWGSFHTGTPFISLCIEVYCITSIQ